MASNSANFFINRGANAAVSQNHQMAAAAATAAALAASQATGKPAAAAASIKPYPNRYGSYAQAQAHAAQEAANHLQQYVSTSNALAVPASTAQATVVSAAPQTSSPYGNTFTQFMAVSAQDHSLTTQQQRLQQQQLTYQFLPQNQQMAFRQGFNQANRYSGYLPYHRMPLMHSTQYLYSVPHNNKVAQNAQPLLPAPRQEFIQNSPQVETSLPLLPSPPSVTSQRPSLGVQPKPQQPPKLSPKTATSSIISPRKHSTSEKTNADRSIHKIYLHDDPSSKRNQFISTEMEAKRVQLKKWHCNICQMQSFSDEAHQAHLSGKRHAKLWKKLMDEKTRREEGPNLVGLEKVNTQRLVTSKSQCILLCQVCHVFTVSVNAYYSHIKGGKHKREVRLREEMGLPALSIVPDFVNTNVVPQLREAVIEEFTLFEAKAKMDPDKWAEEEANRPGPGPSKAAEKLDDLDAFHKPIGFDFIEEVINESGKTVCFMCTLCDVRFNDVAAKESHLIGRKHRITYKKKIDPSLIVMEVKSDRKLVEQMRQWEARAEKNIDNALHSLDVNLFDENWAHYFEWHIEDFQEDLQTLKTQLTRNDLFSRTISDWLVHYRYKMIAAPRQKMISIHEAVCMMEIACLSIADVINSTFMSLTPDDLDEERADKSQTIDMEKFQKMVDSNEFVDCVSQYEKKLQGSVEKLPSLMLRSTVMKFIRVRSLGKGFLLADDDLVDVVLYCNFYPTTQLKTIYETILPAYLNSVQSKFTFELAKDQSKKACFVLVAKSVKSKEPFKMSIRATFTAGLIRNCHPPLVNSVHNLLDREQCLDALCEVRRVRWFKEKVMCPEMESIVFPFFQYTVRVLRSICKANSVLKNIPEYCIELVIVLICNTHDFWQAVVPVIRYFFEILASGILFPEMGVGIGDPCQHNFPSCFAYLSIQERENYTKAVQNIIMLINFEQLSKVLGLSESVQKFLEEKDHSKIELSEIPCKKIKNLSSEVVLKSLEEKDKTPVQPLENIDNSEKEKLINDRHARFYNWMQGQINMFSKRTNDDENEEMTNKSTDAENEQLSKKLKPSSPSGGHFQHQQNDSQTSHSLVSDDQQDSLSAQCSSDKIIP